MDDMPPRRLPPELVIFCFTAVFSAGIAFSNGNANADRITKLETHDREYGQLIAQMKQEIDDLVEHFGIPKRDPEFGVSR